MKVLARSRGSEPLWICLALMLAHADASAANNAPETAVNDAPRCLSLQEVHGGYPRYRIVGGRRCWYASTRGPEAKPAEVDVNPYDDPIWKQSDATGLELATTQLQEGEEQALKLESEEKRTFLKQCMSNAVR